MKNQFVRKLSGLLFFCLILCPVISQAQTSKRNDNDQPIEIKLEHKELGKAPTIPVTINGKTYPFM